MFSSLLWTRIWFGAREDIDTVLEENMVFYGTDDNDTRRKPEQGDTDSIILALVKKKLKTLQNFLGPEHNIVRN